MVRALPEDGNRYEVVYGELLVTPADISWGREDMLVQPDVFVVPVEEVRTLEWECVRGLLLVAEVLSPSSHTADRFTKRRRYQDADVPVYWVVDPDERSVETWTPDDHFPITERECLKWHPAGAAAPLVLELADLFRPI